MFRKLYFRKPYFLPCLKMYNSCSPLKCQKCSRPNLHLKCFFPSYTIMTFEKERSSQPVQSQVWWLRRSCLILIYLVCKFILFQFDALTLFRPDNSFKVLCKQCRPNSDAGKFGVCSRCTLFDYRNFFRKCSTHKSSLQNP